MSLCDPRPFRYLDGGDVGIRHRAGLQGSRMRGFKDSSENYSNDTGVTSSIFLEPLTPWTLEPYTLLRLNR
jgi:hypothetical protein